MNEVLFVILFTFLYLLIAATTTALLKKFIGKKLEATDCTAVGCMFPILLPILLCILVFEIMEEKLSSLLEKN